MIPECLVLDPIQKIRLCEFVQFLNSVPRQRSHDLTLALSNPYKIRFHVLATGLGDDIIVTAAGYKCDLTINDDGEISQKPFEPISPASSTP